MCPKAGREPCKSTGFQRFSRAWLGICLAIRPASSLQRASARPDGSPWSERKKLVWWDAESKKWTGDDVPDFVATKPPDYKPPEDAVGDAALAGDKPFILHADGFGWIWVPVGLNDGPLPAHYEPLESPVRNPMYPKRQSNPVGQNKARPGNEYATSPDVKFPFVLTTYRLTEHHTAGGMSRTLSHLAELQPEMFCEISVELAEQLSITPGEWVTVVTARGAIEAHAMVTPRIQMLTIEGKPVYQVGLPFHWGYSGLVKGDIGNDLVAISEEPNVRIMETKGLLCNILRGKRETTCRPSMNCIRRRLSADGADGISDRRDDMHRLQSVRSCACKEWNEVPEDGLVWSGLSYDNTKSLGASTWRHVLFLEQPAVAGPQVTDTKDPFRWIFLSDVCKHCANAGCLEACPTGSIVRTEVGSVFVQPDVCNGCGYCVVSCPFGVIDRRPDDGRAFKCTFCYDRQKAGLIPACAKACPTQSIQFGDLEELRQRGKDRVQELQNRGYKDARIYDPKETSVGGTHAPL